MMDTSADLLPLGILVGVVGVTAMSWRFKRREKRRTEALYAPKPAEMKYDDGAEMRLGDRVRIKNGESGLIVAVVGTQQFALGYPKDTWSNLTGGVLVRMESGALVNFYSSEHRILIGQSKSAGVLPQVDARTPNVTKGAFARASKRTVPAA